MKTLLLLAAVSVAGAVDFVWPFSGPLTAVLFIVSVLFIFASVVDYLPGQLCVGDDGETLAANERMKIGDGTSHQYISIDGAAANERNVRFQSNNSDRWHIGADSTAEGGSDAGSDFIFRAYDDSGVSLGNVLKLLRASKQVLFPDGTALLPGLVPAGDPDTGFRFAAANPGVLRFSSGGNETLLFSSTGISTSGASVRLGTSAYVQLNEASSTPGAPTVDAQANIYCKGDKFIIQFNDGSTVRYKYLDMTGTGVTWVHTTTPP